MTCDTVRSEIPNNDTATNGSSSIDFVTSNFQAWLNRSQANCLEAKSWLPTRLHEQLSNVQASEFLQLLRGQLQEEEVSQFCRQMTITVMAFVIDEILERHSTLPNFQAT